jgi:hypothetical protein
LTYILNGNIIPKRNYYSYFILQPSDIKRKGVYVARYYLAIHPLPFYRFSPRFLVKAGERKRRQPRSLDQESESGRLP